MVLLIDNYDSFTWNLVQAIEILGETVIVKSNNCITTKDVDELNPDKIIISPGPGTPKNAGISSQIINDYWKNIPLLGVCLGHQCIGEVFGANIIPSKQILHGKTSLIHHKSNNLFNNIPSPFQGARYHSLSLDTIPQDFKKTAWANDGEIMAMKHIEKPVFGVQFHPESFLTPVGNKILENFLNE
ncbi:MAG: aminodeoxychorismate/anthranilate synthase component II [Candidatus Marinimicrobia bacterium]|nr:aminodeoxychorismate/anthranilate synthase component II [Candidatus Neomarinimicrobiota bacterium]